MNSCAATTVIEFNETMDQSDKTIGAGEPIVAQGLSPKIALDVNALSQQPQSYSIIPCINETVVNDGCWGCACVCCLMQAAPYDHGLYASDFKIYNISFLVFALMGIYPAFWLNFLDDDAYFLPCTCIGILILLIASMFMFCVKNVDDVGRRNKCGRVRGYLYIFGGILYALGYFIHGIMAPSKYVDVEPIGISHKWNPWYDYYTVTEQYAEYCFGRGLFVGIHAMFIGYLYVNNNKLPSFLSSRESLIRLWSFLFLIYAIFVLFYVYCMRFLICDFYDELILIIYQLGAILMYLLGAILIVGLFCNFCLIKPADEHVGCCVSSCNCNSSLGLGLIASISFYLQLVGLVNYLGFTGSLADLLWDLSLYVFASLQLWILTRSIHPGSNNCCCCKREAILDRTVLELVAGGGGASGYGQVDVEETKLTPLSPQLQSQ